MVDRPNPGKGVTGGEGKEAWELHGVKAHLWVVLGRGKGLRGGGSTEQDGSAAEASDGEGASVRIGRGEVAWELRGLTAELARGLARAEERR